MDIIVSDSGGQHYFLNIKYSSSGCSASLLCPVRGSNWKTLKQSYNETNNWSTVKNIFCGNLAIQFTKKAQIHDFWQLHPLTYYNSAPEDYQTDYYKTWWVLTPTCTKVLRRTEDGRQLLAINEICRGEKTSRAFSESVCSHNYAVGASDNIFVLKAGENVRNVFGVCEEGPKREYPIDMIRNGTETKYSGRDGEEDGLIDAVFDQDSTINEDINTFTNEMLQKMGFWTYFGYFTGLQPKHSEEATYTFSGQEYKNSDEAKTPYDVPTRYLATATFNCSDFLMGSGSGHSAIKGADMYLINKFFPSDANDDIVKTDKAKHFATIFKPTRKGAAKGGTYGGADWLTVYRPFGKGIWVDKETVPIDDVLDEKWSFIGNRLPTKTTLRCE